MPDSARPINLLTQAKSGTTRSRGFSMANGRPNQYTSPAAQFKILTPSAYCAEVEVESVGVPSSSTPIQSKSLVILPRAEYLQANIAGDPSPSLTCVAFRSRSPPIYSMNRTLWVRASASTSRARSLKPFMGIRAPALFAHHSTSPPSSNSIMVVNCLAPLRSNVFPRTATCFTAASVLVPTSSNTLQIHTMSEGVSSSSTSASSPWPRSLAPRHSLPPLGGLPWR
jgi:hypothetical protein